MTLRENDGAQEPPAVADAQLKAAQPAVAAKRIPAGSEVKAATTACSQTQCTWLRSCQTTLRTEPRMVGRADG